MPSACPNRMPAGRCKALAVRVAAAIELEGLRLTAPEENSLGDKLEIRRNFLKNILNKSDELGQCRRIDVLHRLMDELYALLDAKSRDTDLPKELQEASRRILDRLGYRNDPAPGSAPSVACSTVTCIGDIAGLIHFMENNVHSLYEKHADPCKPERPEITVENVPHDRRNGCFKIYHIEGWTRVRGSATKARVGLQFKDDHLDLRTLRQTVYVITHELVCHAYQSLGDAQREDADPVCSWSDGWMDALAWHMTELLIEQKDTGLPPWITQDWREARKNCESLHEFRVSPEAPEPLNEIYLEQRRSAQDAFYRLLDAWVDTDPAKSRSGADDRIKNFSVKLNLKALSAEQRGDLTDCLVRCLLTEDWCQDEIYVARLTGACNDFLITGDLQALFNDLQRMAKVDNIH